MNNAYKALFFVGMICSKALFADDAAPEEQVQLAPSDSEIVLEVEKLLGPSPAENFTGKHVMHQKNACPCSRELVNMLAWGPSPDKNVIAYYIFRNGEQVATIPVTDALSHWDYNRNGAKQDTYTLTAVDANGVQSTPVEITLP